MSVRRIAINTGRGYRLSLVTRTPTQPAFDGSSTIVLCHGLGVDQTFPLITMLGNAFMREGHRVVSFDFAGHGGSGGSSRVRRVQNFVADIDSVLSWLHHHYRLSVPHTTLIGHSIGALAALIYTARHPRVLSRIILIGCNADAEEKYQQLVQQHKVREYKKYCLIGTIRVAPDFWRDRGRYDIRRLTARIAVPILLMCGTRDTTNSPRDSKRLYHWASSKKTLKLISGEDHHFTSQRGKERVCRTIRQWLKENR